MISLESFKKSIEVIRKYNDLQEELYKTLSKITDGNFIVTVGDELIADILRLLQESLNDENDWIDWWMYEDVEKIVYYPDENKKVDITKVEDLYNFLVENYKDKNA